MGTADKSGAARLLDPSNANLHGQAKVNAEIFTAVEILGRKLERVEEERDRLARRLALIESAATVDEKTGKLYLPVVMEADMPPMRQPDYTTPKWMISASLMSSAIALFALGIVLFRDPAPALTKEQLAMLEQLRGVNFAQVSPDSKGWKSLNNAESAPENTAAVTPQPSTPDTVTPPDQSQLTQAAPAPASATTPAPAPVELSAAAPDTAAPSIEAPMPSTAPPALEPTTKAASTEVKKETVMNVLANKTTAEPKAEAKVAETEPKKEKPAEAKTADAVSKSESTGGIAPDDTLPPKLAELEKRAYQGMPEAQHDLATLYAAGKAIPQDYKRAAYWFEKAADGGIANAHYNLGVIYHQGLGVPVDMTKALGWYQKAAELGHPEAMYNLGIAYIEGIGTKADTEKGISYFKRAAKAGVAQAAYNLGVLYESNFIGPIDTKKAAEWYQVAAKQGHADAREALTRLNGGNPVADSGEQASTLADMAEPAAGDSSEETGEGDSSPASENHHAAPQGVPVKGVLADIQRILIKQGVLPGKADGVLTQQTEDAIRSYQKRFGLIEDGQPSQDLLNRLLQLPPVPAKP